MSIAGKPFLPTLPCCCFNFQAVFGKPNVMKLCQKCLEHFQNILPIFIERLRSLTSKPIAATSVDTKTEHFLKVD